jgi:ribosome biogenesis GTPase
MVRVKRNSGHVIGDDVAVTGEVLKRLPRRTELSRRNANGEVLLLAANLDILGIVIAPLPPLTAGFLDRAIVAARAAELSPFIVINKSDMSEWPDLAASISRTYGNIFPLFSVSASTGEGIETLHHFFSKGHRGAFIGTSGVGKSSLLNRLCPEINLRIGELSDYNSRGCNTTTVSTLHTLRGGGELVDTPGFQDFGLVDITVDELAMHFTGFEKASELACRFHNCRHRTEPGCAVIKLVEQNEIPEERYLTYLNILEEVEANVEETRRKNWKNK